MNYPNALLLCLVLSSPIAIAQEDESSPYDDAESSQDAGEESGRDVAEEESSQSGDEEDESGLDMQGGRY